MKGYIVRYKCGEGMQAKSKSGSRIRWALGLAIGCAVIGGPHVALAAPSACPAFFVSGQAPDVLARDKAARIHTLCYRFYSLVESGVTRTPLWSAEHLTRTSVAQAHEETRVDAFHAETAITSADRAEIDDYRRSGYDRGHMSPSGDMPDAEAQQESFSLANMVPQAPDNNRHLWQGIEISTRALAKYDGELYVVTGPAFLGKRAELDARVDIPSHIWKAIYDPKRGAAAYLTANKPGNGYAVISIAALTRLTGIDPFPALPAKVKEEAIALPPPRPSGRRMKTGPVSLADLGVGAALPETTADALRAEDRAAIDTRLVRLRDILSHFDTKAFLQDAQNVFSQFMHLLKTRHFFDQKGGRQDRD